MKLTLYEKLWRSHVVAANPDGSDVLYIDRHLVHEVSSPQAFAALRDSGRTVRRPQLHLAVADHAVPTHDRDRPIADPQARAQVEALATNARDFGIRHIALRDINQGIVHVVGPEQGFTLPGITLVCGDSHTSTHGAFGALAFGIGSSEAAIVLATQCLVQRRALTMQVHLQGKLPACVSAKDVALAMIARIGAGGATGHALEFTGAVRDMSMAARMTLCNMAIEAGARVALIAPDDTTFAFLHGRPDAPQGADWQNALNHWKTLQSDLDATFDRRITLELDTLAPMVTWGTSPEDALAVDGVVPDPAQSGNSAGIARQRQALAYMGLQPGTKLQDIGIDRVFIGSCTNGRIEDLRAAAAILSGRRIALGVSAMVVPGSGHVKQQAESEGLDDVFIKSGFDWRAPGCSMCVAMNADRIAPGQRCASTSNRNFEGRQGPGGRTHLMSPAMAAAAAIAGHIADVRKFAT